MTATSGNDTVENQLKVIDSIGGVNRIDVVIESSRGVCSSSFVQGRSSWREKRKRKEKELVTSKRCSPLNVGATGIVSLRY